MENTRCWNLKESRSNWTGKHEDGCVNKETTKVCGVPDVLEKKKYVHYMYCIQKDQCGIFRNN